jgi:hypothetical protein
MNPWVWWALLDPKGLSNFIGWCVLLVICIWLGTLFTSTELVLFLTGLLVLRFAVRMKS